MPDSDEDKPEVQREPKPLYEATVDDDDDDDGDSKPPATKRHRTDQDEDEIAAANAMGSTSPSILAGPNSTTLGGPVPGEFAGLPFLASAEDTVNQFPPDKYHSSVVVSLSLGLPKYRGILQHPTLINSSRARRWKPKTNVLMREVLRRVYYLEKNSVPGRFEDTSYRPPRPQHWNRERLVDWLELPKHSETLWTEKDLSFIDERINAVMQESLLMAVSSKRDSAGEGSSKSGRTSTALILPAAPPSHGQETTSEVLKVALPQLAPCWLNRDAGLNRVLATIEIAAKSERADLIVFPECFIPGYPFWLSGTGGTEFESDKQKDIFHHFSQQAVVIENGHLDVICQALKASKMACYLGIVERPTDRTTHSLYISMVYIDKSGVIASVHRKLCPTYEERLVFAPGDGHGITTHRLGDFRVGGLNCWENWMPLSRAALYAQGEDVHVGIWPGSRSLTMDITKMIAKEGRSYSIAVGGLMRKCDVRPDTPYAEEIKEAIQEDIYDGGCCVAGPDGSWILEPEIGKESLRYCLLDPALVRRERMNFDAAGHYSRPDVTKLIVSRKRQAAAYFEEF